jgi:LPXTG-motif cell wall-anchored protein
MRSSTARLGALVLAAASAATGTLLLAPSASAADADLSSIRINEVESQGGDPDDWVELANAGTTAVDVGGLVLTDDDPADRYELPAGTTIPAGGYLVLDRGADFAFGLGGSDAVRLLRADGTVVDEHAWTSHATTTYGRCPDAAGAFTTTTTPTRGAANDCSTPDPDPVPVASTVVVNEVESNGDDTDWAELYNTGTADVPVGGWTFRDSDPTNPAYTLPAGAVVPAGGFYVVDQAQGGQPGFAFGLGGSDAVRLSDPSGALVAEYAWAEHAAVTWGRCPDGTGEFTDTTRSTKGTANNCLPPVVVNEVESQGGTPGDWVELFNVGTTPVDLTGAVLSDAGGGVWTLPAGSEVPGRGYLVLDQAQFGFGLGGTDSVTLSSPEGVVYDSYAWTQHATTTYGRCPNGVGDLVTTLEPTKGSWNACAGYPVPAPWPGGPDETAIDDEATFGGDLSGLDVEPSGTSAPGTLWAVQNGDGLLYRLADDGAGGRTVTGDWTLDYPGGPGGVVDAEGVTVAGDDSAGGVYVSSERDDRADDVSRPSVLRYLPTGTGTLVATTEWDLAPDFPGLGANSGLEGITWVPDTYLVDGGFVDQRTGRAYDPAGYPGHGDGLFLVGVEGTSNVYAYALADDGGFARVATIPVDLFTPFGADDEPVVADVQFDADLGALWVVCDEVCGGQTALFALDGSGTFAAVDTFLPPAGADPTFANEGFAIDTEATCVDGYRATYYADDNDTDGFSLRIGTFPCAEDSTEPGPGPGPGSGGPGTDPGTQPGTQPVAGPGAGAGTDSGTHPTRTELAQTGAEVGSWTALAAGLLVAGAAALVVGRRRHG